MPGAKRDKIRVVIAEDQVMVLGALAALLEMEDDIEVIARARNGEEALRTVQDLRPDVFITDIEMPKLTGLEVAAELKRRSVPVRMIILTTFARAGYLRRALDAGASGYLLKDMPAEQLAEAVRRVHRGLAGNRSATCRRSLERRARSAYRARTPGFAAGRRRYG